MAEEEQPAGNGEQKVIRPQKIFLKDVSFETPNSPEIFLQEWQPDMDIEIDSKARSMEDDLYEDYEEPAVTRDVELDDERFGLTAHLRKSAISIPSNVAEGCGGEGDARADRDDHRQTGTLRHQHQ